jgi:rhodanese-related sulfurtransferase
MGDFILYILIGLMLMWFYYTTFSKVKGLRELDALAFKEELNASKHRVLIDVREAFEVKQGAIQGAIHIPLGELAQRAAEISKDKAVFLYCHSGNRSRQGARILLKNGFEQVTHLKGGMMAWSTLPKK